jgi:TM2 domain-containing membrane protein YozV
VDPCSQTIGFRLAAAAGLGAGIVAYYLLWGLAARLLEGGAGGWGGRRPPQPPDPPPGVVWVDVGAAVRSRERRSLVTFARTLALALTGVVVLASLLPAYVMVGLFAFSGLFGLTIVAGSDRGSFGHVGAPPRFLKSEKPLPAWTLVLVFIATTFAGIGLGAFWAAGAALVCTGWGDPGYAAFLGFVSLSGGQLLLGYARVRAVLRFPELAKIDQRRPVLYLRSFRDDTLTIGTARSGRRTWLDRLAGPYWERFEDVVARHLWDYGPVITVSQPGRSPWRTGAVRDELPSETWQQDIQEWLHAAQLIVVTIGRTAGLQWELERINDLGLWPRVVLLFPPVAENEVLARWQTFRRVTLAGVPGLDLPAEPFGALAAVVRPGESPTLYTGAPRREWGYRVALEQAWRGVAAAASPTRTSDELPWRRAGAVPARQPDHPWLSARTFYVFSDDHVTGPYGFLQLRTMAANREIVGTTQVWTAAGPWSPASEVPGLPSTKRWEVAQCLSLYLGYLGLDRFYLGDVGGGIAKLLTFGGLGVWWIADVVRLAMLRATDARGWHVPPRSPIVWAWMPLLSGGVLAWVPPLHAWLRSHDPVHRRLTIGLAAVCWVPIVLAGMDPAADAAPTQTPEPTVLGTIAASSALVLVVFAVATAYRLRDAAFDLAPGPAGRRQADTGEPLSDKRQLVAGLLGILFGWLGAGRFYVGDTRTALRQLVVTLLTCGLGGLWGMVDGVDLLLNGGYDAQGRKLRDWRT